MNEITILDLYNAIGQTNIELARLNTLAVTSIVVLFLFWLLRGGNK